MRQRHRRFPDRRFAGATRTCRSGAVRTSATTLFGLAVLCAPAKRAWRSELIPGGTTKEVVVTQARSLLGDLGPPR